MATPDDAYEVKSTFNERYGILSRKMLRLLSEDSRVSISELAKALGVSRRTAANRLRGIEGEFSIKYSLELNEQVLNLTRPHLIAVKFKKKPDYDAITKMLQSSYIPQCAVATKGHYDMLVYANSHDSKEYAHWEKSMQILLSEYEADWRTSEIVHRQLGFFPIRNELLDRIDIPDKYKALLKILNVNSRASFNNISKELDMHVSSVAYNFNRLLKLGYIKRFTLSMDPPKDLSFMSFFAKYNPSRRYEVHCSIARKALMYDDPNSLVSRYLITAPLLGSYDFFTMGAFDNADVAYSADVKFHKHVFKEDKVRVVHAAVDRVLFGRLPIRSLDTSKEYNMIRWNVT